MVDGKDAHAQTIEAAILTVKGELQYDTENGIPYFDTIFQNPNKIDLWRAYVIKRVREFTWVNDILSFDVSYDYKNQSVKYDMTVVTDEGIVTVGGNQGLN